MYVSESLSKLINQICRMGESSSSLEPCAGPSKKIVRKQNPLMMDLVLDSVFKFCDFETLGTCRLVCSTWYNAALPFWRETAPMITLTRERQLENSIHRLRARPMMDLDSYIHHLETDESLEFDGRRRYPNICLHKVELGGIFDDVIVGFQNQVAPWITKLWLINVTFQDPESFQNILYSRWTPNLVKLEMDIETPCKKATATTLENNAGQASAPKENCNMKKLRFVFKPNYDGRSLCWMELLKRYPKLEALIISHSIPSWAEQLEKLLSALGTLRKKNKDILALKKLDIYKISKHGETYSITLRILELFLEANLPLSNLYFDFDFTTCPNVIQGMLAAHSSTLKKLKLSINPFTLVGPEVIPLLPALEVLTITGCRLFSSLRFLESVPNLTRLEIEDPDWGLSFSIFMPVDGRLDGLVLRSLTVFKYITPVNPCTSTDLRRMAVMFPNLRHLEMVLTNHTFRVVCERMQNLVTLIVVGNCLDDEGITGIPTGSSEKLRIFPNITMLQSLRNFWIDFDNGKGTENGINWAPNSGLTEIAVTNGILHLPHLETLYLSAEAIRLRRSLILKLDDVVNNLIVHEAYPEYPSDDSSDDDDNGSDDDDSEDSDEPTPLPPEFWDEVLQYHDLNPSDDI